MFKQVFIAGGVLLCAVAGASAQPVSTSAATATVSTAPTALTAIQTCESQMRRLAGLNKVLAANYNAAHVHEVCVANAGSGSDVVSK
jgi:hypothetical protein